MTRRSFLLKWLPVVLTIILIIVLVIVFYSCSSNLKASPYGNLKDDKYYANITGKNSDDTDWTYTLSEKQLYDYIKTQSASTALLTDRIERVIYKEEINGIKAKFDTILSMMKAGIKEENADKMVQMYYDYFITTVLTDCYGTNYEDVLESYNDDRLNALELEFLDNLSLSGVKVVYDENDNLSYTDDICQLPVLEHYSLAVAKKVAVFNEKEESIKGQYCYGGEGKFGQDYCGKTSDDKDIVFTDLIDEDENGVPDDIDSEYDASYASKGTLGAVSIYFNSDSEYTNLLRMLRLSVYGSSSAKWYQFPAFSSDDPADFGNPEVEQEWYDDLVDGLYTQIAAETITPLSDAEVFAYVLIMYNYTHNYRTDITMRIITDLVNAGSVEGVSSMTGVTIYSIVEDIFYGRPTGTAIVNALANSNVVKEVVGANVEESADVTEYTYSALAAYDTENEFTVPYDDYPNTVVRSYIYTTLKAFGPDHEDYTSGSLRVSTASRAIDSSTTSRCFFAYKITESDDEQLFNGETINGALVDDIFYGLIQAQVTDDNVATSLAEKMTKYFNDGRIVIYDPLLEIQYSVNNPEYAKSKDTSTTAVAKVVYKNAEGIEEPIELSVDDFAKEILDMNAFNNVLTLVLDEYLKHDSYYRDQIVDEDLSTSYENLISSFESDSFSSYGYPATMGRNDFIRLYFNGATTKEQAIENMILPSNLRTLYLADYENHFKDAEGKPTVWNSFAEYTKNVYEDAVSVSYRNLLIYIDNDEDGSPDDPNEVYDETELAQMNALVEQLIDDINSRVPAYGLSLEASIENIVAEYNKQDVYISEPYSETLAEFYSTMTRWSEYKKAGIKLLFEAAYDATEDELLNLTEDFATRVRDVYFSRTPSTSIWVDNDEFKSQFDTDLVPTEFGWHAILYTAASKPSSAKFLSTNDSSGAYSNITYSYDLNNDDTKETTVTVANAYNDNAYPSANQIELYVRDSKYGNQKNVYLPDAQYPVYTTVETYFADVKTRYDSAVFNYFVMLDYLEGKWNISDSIIGAEKTTKFTSIIKRQLDEYVDYSAEGIYKDWWTRFAI